MSVIQFIRPLAATNLIIDPSFEIWSNATTPTYWSLTGTGGSINQTSSPVKAGQYSAKMVGGGTFGIYQVIQGLQPGIQYRFSAWIFVQNIGSGGSILLGNSDGSARNTLAIAPPLGQWARYEMSLTCAANGQIQIVFVGSANCIYFIDAVQLEIYDTANTILNPSFDQWAGAPLVPTSWGVGQLNTVTRVSSPVRSGAFSAKIVGIATAGATLAQTVTGLIYGQTYVMSVWLNVTGTAYVTWFDNTFQNNVTTTVTNTNGWVQYTYNKKCVDGAMSIQVSIATNDLTTVCYFDDASILPLYNNLSSELATSYIDGRQPDCYWTGTADRSVSVRPATTRKGGSYFDVANFGGRTVHWEGMGRPTSEDGMQPFNLQDGSNYQRSRFTQRDCSIKVSFTPTSLPDYHAKLNGLDQLLSHKLLSTPQPVYMRYTGGIRDIVLPVVISKDAIKSVVNGGRFAEEVSIPMIAPDPFFQNSVGESAVSIYSNTNMVINGVAERVGGIWDNMISGVAGGTGIVYCIVQDGLGKAYLGGTFTTANGGATTGLGGFAGWNINTQTYISYGAVTNGTVYAIALSPDGLFAYVAGLFTQGNGTTVNNILRITLSNAAIAAIGGATVGTNGRVNGLAFDSAGILHLTGTFTTAGGVTVNGLAKYNPVANTFAAAGTGLNLGGANAGQCLLLLPNNKMLVGGTFSSVNGVTCSAVAMYNTTSTAVTTFGTAGISAGVVNNSTGIATVNAAIVDNKGNIVLAGSFDSAGSPSSPTYNNIVGWNGQQFNKLSIGYGVPALSDVINAMTIDGAGNIYVTGLIGGGNSISVYNGYAWRATDLAISNSANGYALSYSAFNNGTLMFGIIGTQTTTAVGYSVTFTPASTTVVYPMVIFTGPGTLVSLRNSTTNTIINFNSYPMLVGETVVLTLSNNQRSMVSSWKGNIVNYILPDSALSSFSLLPGKNTVTAYITGATGATGAVMSWIDKFLDIHGSMVP